MGIQQNPKRLKILKEKTKIYNGVWKKWSSYETEKKGGRI